MFYRRKLQIALIEKFGGALEATNFQKLLFLLSKIQDRSYYDFIPHKCGCYSMMATYDLGALKRKNLLYESSGLIHKETKEVYTSHLKKQDQTAVEQLFQLYGKSSSDDLLKEISLKYPYYASNSEITERLVSDKEEGYFFPLSTPKSTQSIQLFTIGYEGISIEEYLNRLFINRVSLLCDIRKNPISKKVFFSKSRLREASEVLGIEYVHIPDLGINSSLRKDLSSKADYDHLFNKYEKETLATESSSLNYVVNLGKKHGRIALTCFEGSYKACHRGRVADFLMSKYRSVESVKHI